MKLNIFDLKSWRNKLKIRSQTHQLIKKGIITKKSCIFCLTQPTIITHLDYESPINVIFLCKKHYLKFRQEKREG